MKNIFIICLPLFIVFSCINQNKSDKTEVTITGDYLGENQPDSLSKIFAPGIVSTGLYERDFTITPDGNQIFWTIMSRSYSVIVTSVRKNGVWSKPEVASFSGSKKFLDAEPFVEPNGKKLFFLSTRPQKHQEPKSGWVYEDIWVSDKTEYGWSEAYNLGSPINTDAREYFPSVTKDGTIYFNREFEKGPKKVMRSKLINGKYQEPVELPKEVNATEFQFNPCIAPDESYIILCTRLKEGAIGNIDYAISFRDENDNWSKLRAIGGGVNYKGSSAIAPYITPDGKYLFFSQSRTKASESLKYTYKEIRESLVEPKNGNSDIFWVNTQILK